MPGKKGLRSRKSSGPDLYLNLLELKTAGKDERTRMTEWREISYMRNGQPDHVGVEMPANGGPEWQDEATHFVQTLEDNHQIQHEPGPLKPGKTHQIETNAQGKKLLVHKRFSAI
jgi:hypothetical protein